LKVAASVLRCLIVEKMEMRMKKKTERPGAEVLIFPVAFLILESSPLIAHAFTLLTAKNPSFFLAKDFSFFGFLWSMTRGANLLYRGTPFMPSGNRFRSGGF